MWLRSSTGATLAFSPPTPARPAGFPCPWPLVRAAMAASREHIARAPLTCRQHDTTLSREEDYRANDLSGQKLGSETVFEAVRHDMSSKRQDCVISIHGMRPKDYCGHNVHLFAHSMGSYALRWALQGIKSSTGNNLRRLLEQIILFAADEDDDAFELDYKFQSLPDMARRVTVYHNPGDKTLVVSDLTKGNPDRLGASGPRNSRALPDKVSVVNCESVIHFKDDPTGHQYYRLDETVKQDVIAVLNGKEPQDIKTRKYQPDTRSYRLKRVKA